MGFCLFNNIAVAARYAIDALGLERVLVLDWDVHHGNGTATSSPTATRCCSFRSTNGRCIRAQVPPRRSARGPGRGFTINLPVPAGTGDAVYLSLVADVVVPLTRAFAPELVLISAGFDAHRDDPLASCHVTEAGFAGIAAQISAVCDELGVPLGCVLEGGYDLGALARSVAVTMEVIAGRRGARTAGTLGSTRRWAVRSSAAGHSLHSCVRRSRESRPSGRRSRRPASNRPMMEAQVTDEERLISGVDFVPVPTRDLEQAVRFYGETLALPRSRYHPERHFAEFETGNLTLNVMVPEAMGLEHHPIGTPIALRVEDVAAARRRLEDRGVQFGGDTFDTGVCHMAFFADPDGNALMLHHRYAPRTD